MKNLLLLPLALAFASNAAMAANSVDLRVTGTITPTACDISLSGGDLDFGDISSQEMNQLSHTELPTQSGKSLIIACSGATLAAFRTVDNRSDSNDPVNGALG
ncbi:DUF1120 domain-containing protein [Pseudomonas sp. NPDC098747]|uniref:DUF1120 domain-containing protein n=1 Tax=Pseudomonas sp. NPDC098747 TaxID=3364487 RepID=UPI00383A35E8